ncbi:MAG: FMN-binding protein [bacterium]
MKKIILAIMLLLATGVLFAADEAVTKVLGELAPGVELTKQIVTLTDAQIIEVQTKMGNKGPINKAYEIYTGKGIVVVIEAQMGKWGIIDFAISIDKTAKTIKNIGIIAMREKRGQAIKTANFLSQFFGKGEADALEVGKGIRAVSGATVSSRAVTIAAKRALIVYALSGLK